MGSTMSQAAEPIWHGMGYARMGRINPDGTISHPFDPDWVEQLQDQKLRGLLTECNAQAEEFQESLDAIKHMKPRISQKSSYDRLKNSAERKKEMVENSIQKIHKMWIKESDQESLNLVELHCNNIATHARELNYEAVDSGIKDYDFDPSVIKAHSRPRTRLQTKSGY